jgi:hypothetical protein
MDSKMSAAAGSVPVAAFVFEWTKIYDSIIFTEMNER